jgi:hypothetical protein
MNEPARTQNPVVRKHRVGSSPTSGTAKLPAKVDKTLFYKAEPPTIEPGALAAVGYERASSIAAAWSRMFGSTWE